MHKTARLFPRPSCKIPHTPIVQNPSSLLKGNRHISQPRRKTSPFLPRRKAPAQIIPPQTGYCPGLSQLTEAKNSTACHQRARAEKSLFKNPCYREPLRFPRNPKRKQNRHPHPPEKNRIISSPTDRELPRFSPTNHGTKPPGCFPAHRAKSLIHPFGKIPHTPIVQNPPCPFLKETAILPSPAVKAPHLSKPSRKGLAPVFPH